MEKEAGYRSRDEWETLRHQEFFTPEMAYANTKEDGTLKESKILSVDLRVGNQCNLRCVMCFPGESTRWYRDYKEILQETHFGVDGVIYDLDLKLLQSTWNLIFKSDQVISESLEIAMSQKLDFSSKKLCNCVP